MRKKPLNTSVKAGDFVMIKKGNYKGRRRVSSVYANDVDNDCHIAKIYYEVDHGECASNLDDFDLIKGA